MTIHSPHGFPTLDAEIERRLVESRQAFLRFLRRRVARPEDAEDVLQDFHLKIVRAAPGPEDEDRIDAWLGRILRNALIDHYRRRAARRRAEAAYEREAPLAEVAVGPAAPDEDPCRCARRLLPRLRPSYAEAVRRVDLDEATRETVAAELGLSVNNLNVRLHRARRALKQEVLAACAGCCDGGFASCDCQRRKPR